MILDKEMLIADKQTVAVAQSTVAFTNVLNLGKLGVGRGRPVKLFCEINVSLDSAGDNTTLQLDLAGGTTASLGTALFTTGVMSQATCVKGYRPPQLNITLPPDCPMFIGGTFTIGTATCSAGTVTLGIVEDDQSNKQSVYA